ncbi:membrane protein insertion efficiency factor [Tasmannia lanceolata]|uniref:membrane protein insertion efficiency factor n=1 Tax=Tasmannia lanceolata TaxID=3420 RepID=UPI004062F2BA
MALIANSTSIPYKNLNLSFPIDQNQNPRIKSLTQQNQQRKDNNTFPISLKTLSKKSPQHNRFSPINGLEKDSKQSTIQDEEVKDLGVKAALSLLKFYKREISPLLPSSCRYVPTCSEYSMEAYKKYGVAKGTILTAWRLCRCNPLGGSGFDPPRWFDEKSPSEE